MLLIHVLGGAGLWLDWQAVNDGFNQRPMSIASVATLRMDGDAFAQIQVPADVEKPEY
jgi:hypothetical protein